MSMTRYAVVATLLLVALSAGCKKPPEEAAPPPPPVQQAIVVFEGVAPEDEVILKDLLRVDGVLAKGTQYIVSINGQICNVGENLKLTARTRSYDLKLLSITGDRVLVRAVQNP